MGDFRDNPFFAAMGIETSTTAVYTAKMEPPAALPHGVELRRDSVDVRLGETAEIGWTLIAKTPEGLAWIEGFMDGLRYCGLLTGD